MLQAEETGDPGLQEASATPCVHLGGRLGPTRPEVWRPLGPQRPWCTQLSLPGASLAVPPPTYVSFPRAYGVVSMCMGTGMGAAAVFEYPGN